MLRLEELRLELLRELELRLPEERPREDAGADFRVERERTFLEFAMDTPCAGMEDTTRKEQVATFIPL